MRYDVTTDFGAQVEIKCGSGKSAYTTVLTAKNLGVFWTAAAEQGHRLGKAKGEDLVGAILARGGILSIERFNKNGALNDGAHGDPARQRFSKKTGAVVSEVHYRNGALNDGAAGELAVQEFGPLGSLLIGKSYRDGTLVTTLSVHELVARDRAAARHKTATAITAIIPALMVR
jgi:hypothetical protein